MFVHHHQQQRNAVNSGYFDQDKVDALSPPKQPSPPPVPVGRPLAAATNMLYHNNSGNNHNRTGSKNLLGSVSPDQHSWNHGPRTYYDAVEDENMQPLRSVAPSAAAAAETVEVAAAPVGSYAAATSRSSFLFGEQEIADEEAELVAAANSGMMTSPRSWVPQPQSRDGVAPVAKRATTELPQQKAPMTTAASFLPSAIFLSSTSASAADVLDAVPEESRENDSGGDDNQDQSPRNLWLTDGLVPVVATTKTATTSTAAQTDVDVVCLRTKETSAVATQTAAANCTACDKLREVLTVKDDADFAALQQQWSQLSRMFKKFESSCQKVLQTADAHRAARERAEQEIAMYNNDGDDGHAPLPAMRFRIESDIRSGVLRMVEVTRSRSRSSSAIEQMRSRGTTSAATAGRIESGSHNVSRSASAANPHAPAAEPAAVAAVAAAESRPTAVLLASTANSVINSVPASPLAATATAQMTAAAVSSRTAGSSGPLHFVALRKCLVKKPSQPQHHLDPAAPHIGGHFNNEENSYPRR